MDNSSRAASEPANGNGRGHWPGESGLAFRRNATVGRHFLRRQLQATLKNTDHKVRKGANPAFAANTDSFADSRLLILRNLLKTKVRPRIPAYRLIRHLLLL